MDFRLLDARVNGIMYGDGKRERSGRDEAFTTAFGAALFRSVRIGRTAGERPCSKGRNALPFPCERSLFRTMRTGVIMEPSKAGEPKP